jgi:hypothetical protein
MYGHRDHSPACKALKTIQISTCYHEGAIFFLLFVHSFVIFSIVVDDVLPFRFLLPLLVRHDFIVYIGVLLKHPACPNDPTAQHISYNIIFAHVSSFISACKLIINWTQRCWLDITSNTVISNMFFLSNRKDEHVAAISSAQRLAFMVASHVQVRFKITQALNGSPCTRRVNVPIRTTNNEVTAVKFMAGM